MSMGQRKRVELANRWQPLLIKGALFQRIGMSLVDGLLCGVVIFQRGGPQVMKFRPHIFKIGVVVAPQHFHAVHTNGGPALMVGAFAVTGGKILDVATERRAQVVILQFCSGFHSKWILYCLT